MKRVHSPANLVGQEVEIGSQALPGILGVPQPAVGVVLFAQETGSRRMSPRNLYISSIFHEAGLATLMFDLVQKGEDQGGTNALDIEMLAARLQIATKWVQKCPMTQGLNVGYFGTSRGVATAMVAATWTAESVRAVVSVAGRIDLAGEFLPHVKAPTLLIVGRGDEGVVGMNQAALSHLECEKELAIIGGAAGVLREPGALEVATRLARSWFLTHLGQSSPNGKARLTLDPEPWDDPPKLFRDREEAGYRLADALRGLDLHDPLVLAIPRGGVPIGAILAIELDADLDVVLAQKLRAPLEPELAIGAVGEEDTIHLREGVRQISGVTEEYLVRERQHQMKDLNRQKLQFRSARPAAPIDGRSVIVTDDGMATASTMTAALEVLRAHNPRELIVAVPVGSPGSLEPIRKRCDRLICLHAPEEFRAVGQFYERFVPVEEEQVVETLYRFTPTVFFNED
ncbi:MAG: phosphoribosyltransferase family protein [Gemmataceae bacterium]